MSKRKRRRRLTDSVQMDLCCQIVCVRDALEIAKDALYENLSFEHGRKLNAVPSLVVLALAQLKEIQNAWDELVIPTTPVAPPSEPTQEHKGPTLIVDNTR